MYLAKNKYKYGSKDLHLYYKNKSCYCCIVCTFRAIYSLWAGLEPISICAAGSFGLSLTPQTTQKSNWDIFFRITLTLVNNCDMNLSLKKRATFIF